MDVPYAIFEVKKDEKFTDFDKVRARIEQLTNEEAGGQKNIVDKEIVLTVYSPTAPDLTVIDLPGITRNPVGDQPKNIEEITRNMAERFFLPATVALKLTLPKLDSSRTREPSYCALLQLMLISPPQMHFKQQ